MPKKKYGDFMRKLINNWHFVSVYLACVSALFAILGTDNITTKLLLASITMMFLHFFEEFGFPGGFPFMGMKVLMGSSEMDSTKWNCNNLSSMFGNWFFLVCLYFFPLLLPDVRFLTLSAMMFLFAEVLMHLILFNVKLKQFYNPGFFTGVIGMCPIGIYYFTEVFEAENFVWYDFILAILWFVAIFALCFRSKIYWGLGKIKGYELTEQSAFGVFQKKQY